MQTQPSEKKDEESNKVLTGRALLSLKNKYSRQHGWSAFFEVSLGRKRVDFMAFNIYPSRDFTIVGCEIKASRSDWMKELKHCEKAEPLIKQCDEWYIVEARKGIVQKDELPEGWGLMSLSGNRIYSKVPSKLKTRADFSKELLARIVEKSFLGEGRHPDSVIWDAEKRGYERGQKEQVDTHELRELERKVVILDKLEKGDVKIHEWDLRDVKKLRLALDFINKFGGYGLDSDLKGSISDCESAITKLKEAQDLIEKLKKETQIKTLEKP